MLINRFQKYPKWPREPRRSESPESTVLGKLFILDNQGWGAGAGMSRVFLAPWSRSRLKNLIAPQPWLAPLFII